MAAHFVALRWRLLLGTLRQSPWAIVAVIVTGLGALSLLGMMTLGAIATRALLPELGASAAVLAGAALVVGLTAIAVLVGTSDPLAPERFSLLPLPAHRLRRGLLAAQLLDAWGIVAVLGGVIGLVVWSTSVAALVTAVVALPIVVATVLLITRVVADLVARQLASKRARDAMAILLLVAIAGLAFGMQAIAVGVRAVGDVGAAIGMAARVVAWTPLGAAFDLPRTVAEGLWVEAAAKLAIALATVALSWWAWGRLLQERLTNPIVLRGGGRVREGRLLDRLLPATPVGAIAARSIRYRRRDVRHLMNVIAVLMVPAIVGGLQLLGDEVPREPFAMLPLLMGIIAATMVQIDVAYDNSAFAWHLLTGVRGAQDRAGRLLGTGAVYVPAIVLTAVICTWATGRWELLPASLGVGLGTFGLLSGALLWLAAYLPGEAPPPGANPLGRGSSGGVQSLAGVAVAFPLLAVAGSPFIGLAVAAYWMPWLGWLSLVAALALSALSAWFGIRVGGAALDRRGPEVLAQVSRST
jgi:ABC-2 type transport system permease protein